MIQKILLPWLMLWGLFSLSGCSILYNTKPLSTFGSAELVRPTNFTRDLDNMPPPKLLLPVAIYGFKDQSGQYKPQPDSSFSTAVSQGGTAMLIKALKDSGWFITVERENLQDILTERKIVRAIDQPGDKPGEDTKVKLPTLIGAGMVIEGSVIGYDENVKTGGVGIKWLGLSASQQYRADQVSVNLRAVDIGTGLIMESVTTTKTVYSAQLDTGEYRFVNYQSLLEVELGTSLNEPGQIALQEAIEAAVVNLIVQGVYDKKWQLKNDTDKTSVMMKRYRDDQTKHTQRIAAGKTGPDEPAATPIQSMSAANDDTSMVTTQQAALQQPPSQQPATVAPKSVSQPSGDAAPAPKNPVSPAPVRESPTGLGRE